MKQNIIEGAICYEVPFENDYMKIIRLEYGNLLYIYKCKFGHDISFAIKNTRKQMKKIDDKTYELKEDVSRRWIKEEYTIKKGTRVHKDGCCVYEILDILPKEEWRFELKSSYGITGNTRDFNLIIDTLKYIVENE